MREKNDNMIKSCAYQFQRNTIPVYVVTILPDTVGITCLGTINTIERTFAYCKTRGHVNNKYHNMKILNLFLLQTIQ